MSNPCKFIYNFSNFFLSDYVTFLCPTIQTLPLIHIPHMTQNNLLFLPIFHIFTAVIVIVQWNCCHSSILDFILKINLVKDVHLSEVVAHFYTIKLCVSIFLPFTNGFCALHLILEFFSTVVKVTTVHQDLWPIFSANCAALLQECNKELSWLQQNCHFLSWCGKWIYLFLIDLMAITTAALYGGNPWVGFRFEYKPDL